MELLISFPKVLVAGVNGNVLGFGTALLALCDVVYASSKVRKRFMPHDKPMPLKLFQAFPAQLLGICLNLVSFQATFQTCFTKWGHPPIGCSSFLLSRLLGQTGVSNYITITVTACSTYYYIIIYYIARFPRPGAHWPPAIYMLL